MQAKTPDWVFVKEIFKRVFMFFYEGILALQLIQNSSCFNQRMTRSCVLWVVVNLCMLGDQVSVVNLCMLGDQVSGNF